MASGSLEITALSLALLPQSQRDRSKDYNAYSIEWLPLVASASQQKSSVTIDSSVDFVAISVSGTVTDTATPPVLNTTPQAMLSLQVADRKLFDKDVHWMNFVGNIGGASGPFPLPFPLFLPRATTVTGFLTNLTATAANYRLTIHGYILHDYSRTSSRGY